MADGSRLTQIRQDLSVQITDLYASPGTLLIVHPKEGVQFNPDFAKWLANILPTLLPSGVLGVILPENVTNFDVVGPLLEDEMYKKGFTDAIEALRKINL